MSNELLSERKQLSKGVQMNKLSMDSVAEYIIFKEYDSEAPLVFSCQFTVTSGN